MSPLEARLAVEPGDGVDRFVGHPAPGTAHLFGGLVVAQALHAAARTVDVAQPAHSLHAAFLRGGRTDRPLVHHVERTRDGTSFSTRRVEVHQDDRLLLVLTAGFHVDEAGEEHQAPIDLTRLPDPASLGPGRYDDEVFDSRDVEPDGAADHRRLMWGRARGGAPRDRLWAQLGLAYHSDHGPTRAARQPHAGHPGVDTRMSVSLDHSVWFLRPARLDGWLLSTFTPISTAGARGLVHGTIHDTHGRLLVAVAQEVVLRL